MKKFSSIPSLIILASSIALATTANAKGCDGGGDDVGRTCSSSSSSNGGSSSGGSSSQRSRLRASFPLTIASTDGTAPATKVGSAKLRAEAKRNRTEFRLDAKIKKSVFTVPGATTADPATPIDPSDSDLTTVTATFSDTVAGVAVVKAVCTLDFDEIEHQKAEFHLRLRQRGTDDVQDKAGTCTDPADTTVPPVVVIPTITPGTTSVDVSVSLTPTVGGTPVVTDLGGKSL